MTRRVQSCFVGMSLHLLWGIGRNRCIPGLMAQPSNPPSGDDEIPRSAHCFHRGTSSDGTRGYLASLVESLMPGEPVV